MNPWLISQGFMFGMEDNFREIVKTNRGKKNRFYAKIRALPGVNFFFLKLSKVVCYVIYNKQSTDVVCPRGRQ